MIYELHVTAEATNTCDWIKLCKFIGVKPLIIRLSHGDHVEQFMSSVRIPGDWEMAMGYGNWLCRSIASYGPKILRTKIEIPLDQYDDWLRDQQEGGEAKYLESHIRIDSSTKQDVTLDTCKDRGLAISHSILKGNFWATQRLKPDHKVAVGKAHEVLPLYVGMGGELSVGDDNKMYVKPPFGSIFKRTYEALEAYGVPVIDMHSEAVLMDTNPSIDDGWIKFDLQNGYVAA